MIKPSVIVMDFHVGEASAESFIQRLPAQPKTKHVIISGDDKAEKVAKPVGATFLLKPVDTDLLRTVCAES